MVCCSHDGFLQSFLRSLHAFYTLLEEVHYRQSNSVIPNVELRSFLRIEIASQVRERFRHFREANR